MNSHLALQNLTYKAGHLFAQLHKNMSVVVYWTHKIKRSFSTSSLAARERTNESTTTHPHPKSPKDENDSHPSTRLSIKSLVPTPPCWVCGAYCACWLLQLSCHWGTQSKVSLDTAYLNEISRGTLTFIVILLSSSLMLVSQQRSASIWASGEREHSAMARAMFSLRIRA